MRLKNGLPWSSIQNTGIKASNELISKALEVFHSTDWENHRRNVEQTAIYPDTRTRPYISILDAPEKYKNTVIRDLSLLAVDEVKDLFPTCRLLYSELVCLSPRGVVPWHHDRMNLHNLGTKIMLVLENENVDYYFAPWRQDVPQDIPHFVVRDFIDNESIVHARMVVGSYYIFNQRIPHSTINRTDKSRALLMLEFVPNECDLTNVFEYCNVHPNELESLAPPIL